MTKKDLELLRNNFIMRVEEEITNSIVEVVYLLNYNAETGENVCFIPFAKIKIAINVDLETNENSEWAYLNDLIDGSKPVMVHQKTPYTEGKYICKLPNNIYAVKDVIIEKQNPRHEGKYLFLHLGLMKNSKKKEIPSFDFKTEIKQQFKETEIQIPYHLDKAIEAAIKYNKPEYAIALKNAKERFCTSKKIYCEPSENIADHTDFVM